MKLDRLNFVDGSAAEIQPDGRWDFTLPNGKHVRSQAADSQAAQAAVNEEHDKFVLEQWNKGELYPKQRFLCPLT